jgi:hypothetical protein
MPLVFLSTRVLHQSFVYQEFWGGSPPDLTDMIEGIRSLKWFQIKRPEHSFGACPRALLQNHDQILEELNFGICCLSNAHIMSIVAFRALRSLSLEVGLLYNILKAKQKKSSYSKWKLGTILPESLERLQIAKYQVQHLQPSLEGFVKGLADFVECKMTTHPNLRTICVGSIDVDWDKEPDTE